MYYHTTTTTTTNHNSIIAPFHKERSQVENDLFLDIIWLQNTKDSCSCITLKPIP